MEARSKNSRSDGCPWRRRKSYDSQPICALHEEIEDFFEYMTPTPEEHAMRMDVVGRITKAIQSKWSRAETEVFGSFRTGLYLPTSDLDMLVIGEWSTLPFKSLASVLVSNGICEDNFQILDKAPIPIVKITDKVSGIRVDISFNVSNGVRTTEIVKHYSNSYPMLPKLVLVLKQMLVQRNLMGTYTGGVSAYTLVLMVVSFLQARPEDVSNYQTVNLGVLLMEFLELYGQKFDYANTAIRVRKHVDDVQSSSVLCVEDPLMFGNDVSRGAFGALKVKGVFAYAFVTLNAILGRRNVSPNISILGQILRVDDQVVFHRQWVERTYAPHNLWSAACNNQLETGYPVKFENVPLSAGSFENSAESEPDSSAESIIVRNFHGDRQNGHPYRPKRIAFRNKRKGLEIENVVKRRPTQIYYYA